MSDDATRAIADAIADGFERIIVKLADRIQALEARAAVQRTDIDALSNRIEAMYRYNSTRPSRHPHDPVPLEQTDEAL